MSEVHGLKLLDAAQVAELFDISSATLRKEIAAGKLPFVLIGKRRRFRPTDIETYPAGQTRKWQGGDGSPPKTRARTSGTPRSPAMVVDFARPSRPPTARAPSD